MSNEHVSWEALVGHMLKRRILLEEVDPAVSPLYPFGHRATDRDIIAAEALLGHPLDAQHVELLRRVNGWPQIFASGDLLGTDDFGKSKRWAWGERALATFYSEGDTTGFPSRESIYPIHVVDDSVFVIDMAGAVTNGGHPVYWLAEELVDQWPNVREFWLGGMRLVDHVRQSVVAQKARQAEHNSMSPSNGRNGFTPVRLDPGSR